jgi:formylglycine-generating enzyme required for sulfatase activity
VRVKDVEEFQVPHSVNIPSGTFIQGDNYEHDDLGNTDERPTREVRISESFLLGTTEVTNAQYAAMLNWALDPNGDNNTADAFMWVRTQPPHLVTGSVAVNPVVRDPRDQTNFWKVVDLLNFFSSETSRRADPSSSRMLAWPVIPWRV